MEKIKVGIFFGGQSREREVSFAGGRTVYDNLNKALFEPVPIFVDSLGHFVLLDWSYLYKGTIRDFYPPVAFTPRSPHGFQVYAESLDGVDWDAIMGSVGRPVQPAEFGELMDIAFLALHGPYGEDGNIQGLLEWYGIPYTGAGILPSAFGIDKDAQHHLLSGLGFARPASRSLGLGEWLRAEPSDLLNTLRHELGLPFVVKAARQGSSIGVSIVDEEDPEAFVRAVNRAFFIEEITAADWHALHTPGQKAAWVARLTDIRQGIGLPVTWETDSHSPKVLVRDPDDLFERLEAHFGEQQTSVRLTAIEHETAVLCEAFIEGKEFSCIVIQGTHGEPIALPPTEIIKKTSVFDYRAKYLPGISRKVTPMDVSSDDLRRIQDECSRLFKALCFNVYARLDGFLARDGRIFLNDPNTTSGMMPSSFFFHQAAEIGLNPSQFLTYILHVSLQERLRTGKRTYALRALAARMDAMRQAATKAAAQKIRVAVLLGGYSSERHISVESGRNVFEKLSSSEKYSPFPVFLTGGPGRHELYVLPTNLLLKDNADDIADKIRHALSHPRHEVIGEVIAKAKSITDQFAGDAVFVPIPLTYDALRQQADAVFIALHGRPGEDGEVQTHLDQLGIPYNGSGPQSAATTIDKYRTNEILAAHGLLTARHCMAFRDEWAKDPQAFVQEIEGQFAYPFIAKPSDDGCSSAVKKIRSRAELEAYIRQTFRSEDAFLADAAAILRLIPGEAFPRRTYFLIEELITANGAAHFLEITGGMLTVKEGAQRRYEVFEPSEALASGEILSLEEKFLAGEGQNITPARFSPSAVEQARISEAVRETLRRTAEVLDVEGYCRIDAFVRVYADGRIETILIEVNSLPGMTPATCIFHQAALQHYTPYDFIDRILRYGMSR